jgi:predicted nucleic acid-binding protein
VAEQYRKPYIESSVFIALIKGESVPQIDADGNEVGRENRGDIAKHILALAEAGGFSVYTSTITITEVHKGNGVGTSSESGSKAIDFFRNEFFKIIDVDRTTAEAAHRLCRLHRLKPYDAVHLACALRAGCDVLLTWDTDLLNLKHDGITLAKPQAIGQGVLDLGEAAAKAPELVTTVLETSEPGPSITTPAT